MCHPPVDAEIGAAHAHQVSHGAVCASSEAEIPHAGPQRLRITAAERTLVGLQPVPRPGDSRVIEGGG